MGSHYPGGYQSPNANIRSRVIRLANAEWIAKGGRGIRFIDSTEAWDVFEDDFLVVDVTSYNSFVSVKALLDGLSEDSRKSLLI